jgi:hypothetical protein
MKARLALCSCFLLFNATSPATFGAIEIRDFEASHGPFGPKREEAYCYPSEEIFFRFLVTGVKVDTKGFIDLTFQERILDAEGKVLSQGRKVQKAKMALGGNSCTGESFYIPPATLPPGEYRFELTIIDNLTNERATITWPISLKKTEFVLVMPRLSHDADGKLGAPPAALVGQTLHLAVRALGLDKSKGVLDAEMIFQILDKNGKPTMPEPIKVALRESDPKVLAEANYVRFKSDFTLNRVGDFTLQMRVTDLSAGKTATYSTQLKVNPR